MKKNKSKLPPLEVVYVDPATNETIVLEGRVIPPLHDNNFNINNSITLVAVSTEDSTAVVQQANAMGPMLYVLSVIIVYGLSMFLLVGTLARRKSYHTQLDVEVGRYVKGLRAAREEARKTEVQRLRLNWPGNFIMFQKNPSAENVGSDLTSDSDVKCYPAISKPLEISSSEESSYIELPATTVNLVTETHESSRDLSERTKEENTESVTISVASVEAEEKGVHFDESNLEISQIGSSQFSLRDAVCLSNENMHELLQNKHISMEDDDKEENMPMGNNVGNVESQDLAMHVHSHAEPNIIDVSASDNPSDIKTLPNKDTQKIKKTKKRRKLEKSKELSSTEDIEDPVMEEYHKSAAYRQRNRRRNSQMNEALKATSLNRLELPSTVPHAVQPVLAPVHLLGVPKSDMDIDSASDDPCFEEYRRSKLYKSRYRGKKGGLLDPLERRISSSSTEGSPLLPTTRRIQQRYSSGDRPNINMIVPPRKRVSSPLIAIKVTPPEDVVTEVCDVDDKC